MLTKLLSDPRWSEQERVSSSAMHEGVFSRLWWKSSVNGARGHRRLCHFSCSVKVKFNINRHNLAKLRKKESYYFHKPPVRRRLGWQPVNGNRSVCAKRWLPVREDVAKCAANLIAICTVVLRQTWQYGVNRRCVPPFFVHYLLGRRRLKWGRDQSRFYGKNTWGRWIPLVKSTPSPKFSW